MKESVCRDIINKDALTKIKQHYYTHNKPKTQIITDEQISTRDDDIFSYQLLPLEYEEQYHVEENRPRINFFKTLHRLSRIRFIHLFGLIKQKWSKELHDETINNIEQNEGDDWKCI